MLGINSYITEQALHISENRIDPWAYREARRLWIKSMTRSSTCERVKYWIDHTNIISNDTLEIINKIKKNLLGIDEGIGDIGRRIELGMEFDMDPEDYDTVEEFIHAILSGFSLIEEANSMNEYRVIGAAVTTIAIEEKFGITLNPEDLKRFDNPETLEEAISNRSIN